MIKGKILITGSNGQLGQCLRKAIESSPYIDQYIFTNRTDFDITNINQMEKYLQDNEDISIIINCAAYTDVKNAETTDGFKNALLINRDAVKNLAILCNKYNIFLVHFGTDYMYRTYENKPIKENEIHWSYKNEDFAIYANEKINKYGLSKLLGIRELFNEMKEIPQTPRFVVIIVSWLFSEYGKNFVKTIYNKIINGENLEVVLTQIGSPTYAMDLAKFIVNKIEIEDGCFITNEINNNWDNGFDPINYAHILNFANLGLASWYDMAKFIEGIVNGNNQIVPREKPFDNIIRPEYSVLCLDKLLSLNNNKSYIRHWTSAIYDCVNKIAENGD